MDILNVAMRFVHILSAVTLLGGVIAWLYAAGDAHIAAWRPVALSAIGGLLVSGLYNFLRKSNLTPAYHAVFGVKVLLALHVFAVVILATKPENPRRARQLTGVAISGVLVVLLSAILRALTLV